MRCADCQAELNPDERFCGNCGHPVPPAAAPPLPPETKSCPGCGARNDADQRFCGSCGHPLSTPVQPQTPPFPAKVHKRSTRRYALGAVAVLAVLVGLGLFWSHRQEKERFLARVSVGDTAAVRSFLAGGMSPDARDGETDWTALMVAALLGHTETAQALIAAGADVNAEDEGFTALMCAADGGHANMVKALIAAGADVNAKNTMGETALMRAEKNGHPEIVGILRQSGAKQ